MDIEMSEGGPPHSTVGTDQNQTTRFSPADLFGQADMCVDDLTDKTKTGGKRLHKFAFSTENAGQHTAPSPTRSSSQKRQLLDIPTQIDPRPTAVNPTSSNSIDQYVVTFETLDSPKWIDASYPDGNHQLPATVESAKGAVGLVLDGFKSAYSSAVRASTVLMLWCEVEYVCKGGKACRSTCWSCSLILFSMAVASLRLEPEFTSDKCPDEFASIADAARMYDALRGDHDKLRNIVKGIDGSVTGMPTNFDIKELAMVGAVALEKDKCRMYATVPIETLKQKGWTGTSDYEEAFVYFDMKAHALVDYFYEQDTPTCQSFIRAFRTTEFVHNLWVYQNTWWDPTCFEGGMSRVFPTYVCNGGDDSGVGKLNDHRKLMWDRMAPSTLQDLGIENMDIMPGFAFLDDNPYSLGMMARLEVVKIDNAMIEKKVSTFQRTAYLPLVGLCGLHSSIIPYTDVIEEIGDLSAKLRLSEG